MSISEPERLARKVVELCANCDECRQLMEDTPCLFFPRLFQLYDREKDQNKSITSDELRKMVDLCNMCGLCTCFTVRADIREAKDAFVARDGLKPAIRILEDVQRVGKICGAFPRLANLLVEIKPLANLAKRVAGIHPKRKLPKLPPQGFDAWAKKRGLHLRRETTGPKVAYFVGCTARYLFPEVAKATVEVLERNGVTVYFPEQKCCGMPSLLEGDRPFTFEVAGFNLRQLEEAIDDGYDIVCSCSTCGYMLKGVLSEGAYLSGEYRDILKKMLAEAGGDPQIVWERILQEEATPEGRATPASPRRSKPPLPIPLIVSGMLQDEGYFAEMSARKRIKIASHSYDVGEYLRELDRSGKFNRDLGPVRGRMAYYAPCHSKEQDMGRPWAELLSLVPEISMENVGGAFDCCGISGIMGFKKEFHGVSMAMGSRLMKKIKAIDPETLVSDCLSCRIQFNQELTYPVLHPVEVLNNAYLGFLSLDSSSSAGHDCAPMNTTGEAGPR
jgi:glycerol-3-phosphate dehydrogenase subunit C